MLARTHDVIALAALLTLTVSAPPQQITVATVFVALIGNVVGSLIPDIDEASNRLWDLLPAGSVVGKVADKLFFKHRTFSHSLFGGFLLYVFLSWLVPLIFNPEFITPDVIIASVMVGFGSHLLADSFTRDGIPLFWPIPFRVGIPPIPVLRLRTGSWVEKVVVFPAVLVYIVWLIFSNQDSFRTLLQAVR